MCLTPRGEELSVGLVSVMSGIEKTILGGSDVDPTRITEPIIITCADEEILLHGADILRALDREGCPAPVQFLSLNTEYRSELLWRKRLAVTISTMLYAPEGLKQRKLYDEALVCLLRADHPAANDFDLEAYLAADHLLIAPLGGAPTGYIDGWFRGRGQQRKVRMISHTFGSAAALVKKAGLVATVPSRQAALSQDDKALIAVPIPAEVPPFSVHMFWSERYAADPVNKWLRNTLAAAITDPSGARADRTS